MKALNIAVSKHRAGDPKAAGVISAIVKDASELYTDHIWREDYLLFPMSGKVLLDTDRAVLVKDFAEVQTKFDSAFQDKYEALVEKLEKELGDAAGSDGTAEDISVTPGAKGVRLSAGTDGCK